MLSDAPRVTCQSSHAHMTDLNVLIGCVVQSRPRAAIVWIIDDNGTRVTEKLEALNYYIINTVAEQ